MKKILLIVVILLLFPSTLSAPGSVGIGPRERIVCNVQAFGADPTYATDSTAAIKATIAYALDANAKLDPTYGSIAYAVYIPAGRYKVTSTISGDNSPAGTNKALVIYGDGPTVTNLTAPSWDTFTGNMIFDMNSYGPAVTVRDMAIGALTGTKTGKSNIREVGIMGIYRNLWLAGAENGILIDGSVNGNGGGIQVDNCVFEMNHYGIKTNASGWNRISNCMITGNTYTGVAFLGTYAGAAANLTTNTISNCQMGGNGSAENSYSSEIYCNSTVPTIIDNISANSSCLNGIICKGITTGAVTISNSHIRQCKNSGILQHTFGYQVNINNCVIDRIGYYDQSTPWLCYGIRGASNSGTISVSNTTIKDCAGYGANLLTPNVLMNNVLFDNNCNGGVDADNDVNAICGASALRLEPQATVFMALIDNCQFKATTGKSTGKTAVYIDNDATPVNNNIVFTGNNVTAGHFANDFASAFSDTAVAQICQFSANSRLKDEPVATFTDSDATPSVAGAKVWLSNTTGVTITRFDDGVAGDEITITSKGAIVFDTTANARLIGSSVDITTASGDVTFWVCETGGTTSSVWRLRGFVDVSADNSGGA